MADPHGVFCFAADVAENRPESGASVVRQHIHSFHEFLFLRAGEDGVQYCADRRFALRPGDLFFLPAGLWHIAGATRCAPAFVLNFYTQSLSGAHPGDQTSLQVLSALLHRDVRRQWQVPLSPVARTRVEALLAECARECAELKPGWQAAAHIALQSLLLLLHRGPELGAEVAAAPGPGLSRSQAERMEEVLGHIQAQLASELSVPALARSAGMSRSLFHVAFKAYAGMTLTQYVNRLRVQRAADLLQSTEHTLTAVSQECGFPCISHFHAVFKRHTGVAPGAMRRGK